MDAHKDLAPPRRRRRNLLDLQARRVQSDCKHQSSLPPRLAVIFAGFIAGARR
jgi:hypothetical protein